MASIRKIIDLDVPAETAWDALADFHHVHTRLAPGFVTDSQPDGDTRIVTFANGSVARERLITSDAAARRLVYAIANERLSHYSASAEIVPAGPRRCSFIWTVDLSPDAMAPYVDAQMTTAVGLMKAELERAAAA